MAIHCFTSFSFSYLTKARVLAESLKKHHPNWHLWAVVSDKEPPGFALDLEKEAFDQVIWAENLLGPEASAWLFKHDVVELCTAVKGLALKRLLDRPETEKVFYLDPDIAVLGSLQAAADMLEESSVLLTPHQLEPNESEMAIFDNEVSSLKFGAYNLGFLGVRNDAEGRRFATWWADCLYRYCYDEPEVGLFVDQKWCDLAPAFFDNVRIIRDPGYNVASWNLSRRHISIERDGRILANGALLRFFHFTKLGPVGDTMTKRYARDNIEVFELWAWYKHQIERHFEPAIPSGWWTYGRFSNGAKIGKTARVLYRRRNDLREAYPNPFKVETHSFYSWLLAERPECLRGA